MIVYSGVDFTNFNYKTVNFSGLSVTIVTIASVENSIKLT